MINCIDCTINILHANESCQNTCTGDYCFSSIRSESPDIIARGCLANSLVNSKPLFCIGDRTNVTQGLSIICCNTSLCNSEVPSTWLKSSGNESYPTSPYMLYALPIIIVITILFLLFAINRLVHSHRSCRLKCYLLRFFSSNSQANVEVDAENQLVAGPTEISNIARTEAALTDRCETVPFISRAIDKSSSLSSYQMPSLMKAKQTDIESKARGILSDNNTCPTGILSSTQEIHLFANGKKLDDAQKSYLKVIDHNNHTAASSTSGFNSDRTSNSLTVATDDLSNAVKYPIAHLDSTEDENSIDVQGNGEQYSSSGCGAPLLIQRSIARQIVLKNIIGRGRFGEVWRGVWRTENVAVKIFSSHDETCWQREVEIYQTCMLRHENILGYISADIKDNGTYIQLFLITDFHERGSLLDYLTSNSLTVQEMISMAHSIVSGLCHLHYEIDGLQGKPPIAHRDLKSKNILVKSNTSCVIGDLGLAVRQLPHSRNVDLPSSRKVGTRRYLPPEVLLDPLNTSQFDFEAFRMGDIYSLGLVLWELMNRTSFPINSTPGDATESVIPANEYSLPFQNMVSRDPSINEMHQIVAIQGKRPPCAAAWQDNQVMNKMASLICECWTQAPTARLTTLRAKKNLAALDQMVQQSNKIINTGQ